MQKIKLYFEYKISIKYRPSARCIHWYKRSGWARGEGGRCAEVLPSMNTFTPFHRTFGPRPLKTSNLRASALKNIEPSGIEPSGIGASAQRILPSGSSPWVGMGRYMLGLDHEAEGRSIEVDIEGNKDPPSRKGGPRPRALGLSIEVRPRRVLLV